MFDPRMHQLEIAYLAMRRWQEEVCRVYGEPDPVRREARRQEALNWVQVCWEKMMEVLSDVDNAGSECAEQ